MMILLQFAVCLISAIYFTIWANSSIDGRSVEDAFTYLELKEIAANSNDYVYTYGPFG